MKIGVLLLVASFLVNTPAGTFRCAGPLVRFDSAGVPSSGAAGSIYVPCKLVVEIRETI
jgi:hypothetical protein